MSDELKLSNQLIDDIRAAIAGHDERADDDLIMVQYLSACNGFLLGQQQMPLSDKEQINQQLHEFTQHVLLDTDKQMQPPAAVEPAGDAFGVWKPGDA